MNSIERSGVELKHFQIKVTQLLRNRSGLLVVHGTGTGKTLSSILASQTFLDNNPKGNVIWVAPKAVQEHFKNECKKYKNFKHSNKYSQFTYRKLSNFIKDEECKSKKDPTHRSLCNSNTMLIIDEAHNLRNRDTISYKEIFKYSKKAGKRLLFTATPYVNCVTDFGALINLIYGKNIIGKKNETGRVDYFKKSKEFYNENTSHNLDILEKHLNEHIYYLDKNFSEHFPSYSETFITATMNEEYEMKYIKLVSSQNVGKYLFKNPLAFLNGYRRAVNKVNDDNGNLNDFTMKLQRALPILKSGKTVIYTNWINFGVKPISAFLKINNLKYRIFSGETSDREREEVIKEYNLDSIDVLIITSSGSEGINLLKTKNMIILEPTWNPASIQQIIGRVIRYKSHDELPVNERHVNIYKMILTGRKIKTGDEMVYDIVNSKTNFQENLYSFLRNTDINFLKLENVSDNFKSEHEFTIDTCSICLENVVNRDSNNFKPHLKLKCDHHFHTECVVEWLKVSKTCPLCRSFV